jgi:hypothetical protein
MESSGRPGDDLDCNDRSGSDAAGADQVSEIGPDAAGAARMRFSSIARRRAGPGGGPARFFAGRLLARAASADTC